MGEIFRWHVQNHTKLGAQVRRVSAGELVGDDLVETVVHARIEQHDWNYGLSSLFRRKEYVSRSTRADVTAAAVAGLDLTPGREVWAAVKATETHAYPA